MEPNERDIADAKAKAAGRELSQITVTVEGEDFTVLACTPNVAEFAKFMDDLDGANASRKMIAHKHLVMATAMWPVREEIGAFAERKPLAMSNITSELSKFVGLEAKVQTKKL